MRQSISLTLSTLSLLFSIGVLSAQVVIWDGGGTDNDWSTPQNWDGDVLPGSSDVAQVNTGGVTINVTTNVAASYFSNNDGGGNLVTLNLNSGRLTENDNTFGLRFVDGSNTVINVAGGELFAGALNDVYGPTSAAAESLIYNITGGGIYGYDRFRYDSVTVNLSGGVLDMAGSTGPSALSIGDGAALNMSGNGTFIFDIFGNGSNDSLLGTNAVDMSDGIVAFRFADGYTPQVGDSYDFLGVDMIVDGTGSNIATTDVDGKYNITWDTSQWGVGTTGSDASKGVLTIDGITVIPEPSAYVLLVGCLGLAAVVLRRRR
jgi:hypothetical protein